MWRVLPFLLVVVVLVVVALVAYRFVGDSERRARRHRVRDDIDAETARWQAGVARDDIERHRARMNRDIDDQFGHHREDRTP